MDAEMNNNLQKILIAISEGKPIKDSDFIELALDETVDRDTKTLIAVYYSENRK